MPVRWRLIIHPLLALGALFVAGCTSGLLPPNDVPTPTPGPPLTTPGPGEPGTTPPPGAPATTTPSAPGTTPTGGATAPTDARGLVEALTAAGLAVTPAGPIQQPFFSTAGTVYMVNNTLVQVFAYASAEAAAQDAAKVASDGHIPGYFIQWVGQPHFYRNGSLIVIYVGSDPAVRAALDRLLGAPFAIGEEPTIPSEPQTPTPQP